jgi:Amt family ammonium transporter
LAGQFLIGLVVSAVTYPLAGFWTGGGGWLARLGQTLSLGHGLVDFAGAGTLFVQSGATALAAALVFKRPADAALAPSELSFAMPQSHRSLLAGTGALLAAGGWIAMNLVNPLYTALGATLNWPLIALNGLAGLAGGALAAQLYSGFSTGRLDPLWGPRGALAGLIAVSAGAPFLPTWAALLSGAVAGLLLPFAHYTVERLLRLEDNTAAVASYLLPGLWGLVAVALFADGRWGQNWNNTIGVAGQGVSGLWVAAGLQTDAGQMGAQVWGGIALLIWGFVLPWSLFKFLNLLTHLRLPRKISSESEGAPGCLDGVVHVNDGS